MRENLITRCKTEREVIELISFFESVFYENHNNDELKKTSQLKKQMMIENINKEDYWLCYIKNENRIISGIYAIKAGDKLYLDVLAVDKKYRKCGNTIMLIDYILNNSKSVINEIIVYPNKHDKDNSFNYYIYTGFRPILCLSCFKNIDFENYNKYDFNIYESNIDTFNDEGITKYYSTIKYYIDIPKDEYISYYENKIPDVDWCYMFVKKVSKSNTRLKKDEKAK